MKAFDRFRTARREVYERLFSAKALCITGLIIMPALLFSPSTLVRVIQFLFFWFLAWLAGKKNNPLLTISVILGITAFNLIIPYGQVLFFIGRFRITDGALAAGIRRAVTLEALIMLSRSTIRPDLKIPGLFGELIGESFRIFALLMNQKRRITRKNLIADIDSLLFELCTDVPQAPRPGLEGTSAEGKPAGTKPLGYLILAVVAFLSWLPMLLFIRLP